VIGAASENPRRVMSRQRVPLPTPPALLLPLSRRAAASDLVPLSRIASRIIGSQRELLSLGNDHPVSPLPALLPLEGGAEGMITPFVSG